MAVSADIARHIEVYLDRPSPFLQLRPAASRLVGKSRGERVQAKPQIDEIKPLLDLPAPKFA